MGLSSDDFSWAVGVSVFHRDNLTLCLCMFLWVSVLCSARVSNTQSRLVVWPRTDDPVLYCVTFVQRGNVLTLYSNSAFMMKSQLVCPSTQAVKATKLGVISTTSSSAVYGVCSNNTVKNSTSSILKLVYSNIGFGSINIHSAWLNLQH